VDRSRAPGDFHRRPAALLTFDRLGISFLERTVELDNARLRLCDWPGLGRALVHVPDPLFLHSDAVVGRLSAALAPRYRVLSLSPRGASPYQVDAIDLLGMLRQFGFEAPILVGERLGCLPALLVTAWYPEVVGGLVLVDPNYDPPPGDRVEARALCDCPPDWPTLRTAVRCPVLVTSSASATLVRDVETFATGLP
jgi:pimeloyl-ACP methyl ester carboxylesterase